MSVFDKNKFKELSKLIDAEKYEGCCYYPCNAHLFRNVTFNKEFNFEGYIVYSDAEDINAELNEILKMRTYNSVEFFGDGDNDVIDNKITISITLQYYSHFIKKYKESIEAELVVTQEICNELMKNCNDYGHLYS